MSKKRFLANYTVFDIIIIAICASLGIAIKPVIVPLVHIITGPLFLPGGAIAGGFYMLFILLAATLVKKPFSATLACAVQAILVIVTGVIGSHGIFSIITYTLPGLIIDAYLWFYRKSTYNNIILFFAGLLANITGSFLSNVVFFRLPLIPLMVTLFASAVSGGLGGILCFQLTKTLTKLNPALKVQQENDQPNKKNKPAIVIALIIVLTAGLFSFVMINMGGFQQMLQNKEKANDIVEIYFQDEVYSFDLEYLMAFEPVEFPGQIKEDGQAKIGCVFTGVLLNDVLKNKGVILLGDENISFYAIDGYTSVGNAEEVLQAENVYLAYMRDGKMSGSKQTGGTGPIEIIIVNDVFSQRWCKFLTRIEIT